MVDIRVGDPPAPVPVASSKPPIVLNTKYRSLLFFVKVSDILGMLMVAGAIVFGLFGIAAAGVGGLMVSLAVFVAGLAIMASGQIFKVVIDIEENTRALALMIKRETKTDL